MLLTVLSEYIHETTPQNKETLDYQFHFPQELKSEGFNLLKRIYSPLHNGLFIIQILCYMCASLACQTCSTPLLTQHYEIRQCVLLQMCRQQGTPSPLAGPLFRFQLYFSFPLNPGPAAEEMTIEGEIHNISSHLPTLPTHSLISPSMRAKMAFFFLPI